MLQAVAELALVDGDPAAPGAASRIVTGRRERGDGKWELSLEDGSRLTVFRNGTHKEARAGGVTVVRFNNGDVRQSWGDRGVVVYYYSDASTVHVTHSSGEQVFRFPSGQVERHAADGTKHIDYPDGTQKTVMPSGEQRSTFPDGTTMVELPDGSHVVSPPGRASSGK
jgi:centromere protein J